MHGEFYSYTLTASKAVLILLSFAILIRCLRSMLREKYDPEVWAYLRYGRERYPVEHWEVIIGRAKDADICIPEREIAWTHAVLRRSDDGQWRVNDVFGRGGVWVNNLFVDDDGADVSDGDTLNLNGIYVKFQDLSMEKRGRIESKRAGVGRKYSPALTLLMLTVFQLFLLLQHAFSASPDHLADIALGFCSLIVMEWSCFNAMRIINRTGFEIRWQGWHCFCCSAGGSARCSAPPGRGYPSRWRLWHCWASTWWRATWCWARATGWNSGAFRSSPRSLSRSRMCMSGRPRWTGCSAGTTCMCSSAFRPCASWRWP